MVSRYYMEEISAHIGLVGWGGWVNFERWCCRVLGHDNDINCMLSMRVQQVFKIPNVFKPCFVNPLMVQWTLEGMGFETAQWKLYLSNEVRCHECNNVMSPFGSVGCTLDLSTLANNGEVGRHICD